MRRELPNSYVNSIQSSTNPDDGHGFSSSTPNTATHIGYNDQNSKAIHSSVEPSGQVTKFQEFALDEYPNKNNVSLLPSLKISIIRDFFDIKIYTLLNPFWGLIAVLMSTSFGQLVYGVWMLMAFKGTTFVLLLVLGFFHNLVSA